MDYALTVPASASKWDQALYAFLAEKYRRSNSLRTPAAYSSVLKQFFGIAGRPPDEVTSQDIFTWAYSRGASGKEPSSVTVGARIAAVSSYYRFLIRMQLVAANPCDRLERPKTKPGVPRGLDAHDVRKLLAVVPVTPAGLRDRAIVLTLVLTGRRRAEVLGLKAGDLNREADAVYYRYRGKGGKTGRRELPAPALQAIEAALAASGKALASLKADESLWPGKGSAGITASTFYGRLRHYLALAGLPLSGVHVLRHTAAKLRRDAGESIEDVSRFLGHSSLAVTSVYLRRLEGQEDKGWGKVAAAIGVSLGHHKGGSVQIGQAQ